MLELIEKDPVPYMRHKALRYLVETPPFDRARHHKNDRQDLVEKLWSLMTNGFWFDSRLRCDVVDLYYELYGRKKPVAVPIPELSALKPQKVEKSKDNKQKGDGKEVRVLCPNLHDLALHTYLLSSLFAIYLEILRHS